MSRVVFGVDPSSRKVAVTITGKDGKPRMVAKALPQAKPKEACVVAYGFMRRLVKEYADEGFFVWVFIEAPVLGRGGARATIPQARVQGALMAGAGGIVGVEVHEVNNVKAKKVIVGKGNAGKPQIAAWCRKYWREAHALSDGDQDLIDSAMINAYGQHILAIRERLMVKKTRTRRSKVG